MYEAAAAVVAELLEAARTGGQPVPRNAAAIGRATGIPLAVVEEVLRTYADAPLVRWWHGARQGERA